ncbi:hypothetical protein [Pseudogracilibacillus sp. ICA-222130]|uniref:hypothetical protein n=1 Tax=Pseudogracilibacillus sp. ICA-222130 TaxID=3134655 RepID=UPI0030C0DE3D
MITIRTLLLTGHILLAIIWVGGILFVGWGIFPLIQKMSLQTQRFFLTILMKHTHIGFTVAGVLVIITGVLLGTLFGPMGSMEQIIATAYGQKLLFAFAVAVFAILWGIVFGYRHTMNVLQNDVIWEEAIRGNRHLLQRSFRQIMLIESVEVACFFILVYTMVLL